jgi:hypothetical protein
MIEYLFYIVMDDVVYNKTICYYCVLSVMKRIVNK